MRQKERELRVMTANWSGKAARILAAGSLAFALGMGLPLSEAVPAQAADATGKVTIELPAGSQREGHTTNANDASKVRYSAYKVFEGEVGSDAKAAGASASSKNRVSEIAWASDAMHKEVVKAIKIGDSSYEDPADNAESALKAAEYIANHIGPGGLADEGNPSQDSTLQLESSQFGSKLAAAISTSSSIVATRAADGTVELEPGKTYSFSDGWYLFVTADSSVNGKDDSRTGTSPIFAAVGGEEVRIAEKASVPTIDKQVKDDSRSSDGEADWGMAADAHAGQAVEYRLIGTVANNIHSYSSYYYKFTDTLEEGLALNAKSGQGYEETGVRVYLHKAHLAHDKSAAANDHSYDVTGNFDFTVSSDKRKLEAEAANLRELSVNGKASPSYAMVAGDYLTLEYTAELAPNKKGASEEQGTQPGTNVVQGSGGNRNAATVTYSSNPQTTARGTSFSEDTLLYTYSLRLHKQDKQNASRPLSGAKFTLMVVQGDDSASQGKYVQADGSLGSEAHEFMTDTQGNLLVRNLDAGTYQLVETGAPPAEQASGNPNDAYELLEPATISIGSNVHSSLGVGGEAYKSGNIYQKETEQQVLEVSAKVTGVDDSTRGSLIDLADSIDASGTKSGTGVTTSPSSAAASGANASDGNVSVVVREVKETQMPLTGGAGIALFALFGGVAVASGAGLLTCRYRNRRNSEEA